VQISILGRGEGSSRGGGREISKLSSQKKPIKKSKKMLVEEAGNMAT